MKFRNALFVVSFLAIASCSDEHWKPPQNPDPGKILEEARADQQTGNYAVALDKHVWYHENKVTFDRF